MTKNFNDESKLFFLVRSDKEESLPDFMRILATTLRRHMLKSMSDERYMDRMDFYLNDQPSFPKICKRFKNKHILSIETESIELIKNGIPVTINNDSSAKDIMLYIVGPCKRSELPKNIDGLQLLQDCMITPGQDMYQPSTGRIVEILYRNDIDIPVGKLIPQLGHAIQKQICEQPVSKLYAETSYVLKAVDVITLLKNNDGYITDAGRTVFNKPTITTGFKII